MKKLPFILILLLALVACDEKYPELEDGLYAEIVTDKGTMLAELYFEKTPGTVASFVSLAEGTSERVDSVYKDKPFYDGLTFHRIIKGFMIQGGDPSGTGSGGPGYKFHDELSPELRHDTTGILSMANSGYGTNGSQFFITLAPTPHLDGYDEQGNPKNCASPNVGCHTVFGKLVKGFDTLEAIANVEMADPRAGKPKSTVTIETVNIIRKGAAARKFDAPEVFEKELAAKAEEEKKAAEALEALKKEKREQFEAQREQAEILESGLGIYISQKSDGPKPKPSQEVNVHYAGYFSDGELFDTSIKEVADKWGMQTRPSEDLYQPLTIPYGPEAGMIAGFKEGVQQLKVGEKATLFIPYHLGYGERGYAIIPPRTDLVFEIELVGIEE